MSFNGLKENIGGIAVFNFPVAESKTQV